MVKKDTTLKAETLLVNSNVETQVEDKPIKKATRVVIVSILSFFILMGYIFGFLASSHLQLGNNVYISVFDKTNYENSAFGDLCVVKQVEKYTDISVGDIVFYTVNGTTYSGQVSHVSTDILQVENGEISIAKKNLEGVLINKLPLLGLVVGLFTTYYGAIIFSVILFIYLLIITIKRIDYENTKKGKELRDRYKREQQLNRETKKQRKKLVDQNKKSLINILESDAITSMSNINIIAGNKKSYETYELLVNNVHEKMLASKMLTRDDKQKITLLVELCACSVCRSWQMISMPFPNSAGCMTETHSFSI